jgi:hypothetical protein
MTPQEKRTIEKFFHPKTIKLFVGKHPSKQEKKGKLKFMFIVATEPATRDVVPGRWLMEMDRKHRNGEP